jgi:hypothetical protein
MILRLVYPNATWIFYLFAKCPEALLKRPLSVSFPSPVISAQISIIYTTMSRTLPMLNKHIIY